jgi:hypothetical protein
VWPFSFERATGLTVAGIIIGLGLITFVVNLTKSIHKQADREPL